MRLALEHPWHLSPRDAAALQRELAGRVETGDRLPGTIHSVAGVDVGFEQDGRITRAAVAVLGFPGLEPRQSAIARLPTEFPYVPGLLSFRELPAVLAALRQSARECERFYRARRAAAAKWRKENPGMQRLG